MPIAPKPIEYRQLFAVTRDLLLADLTLDNFEWIERIKNRLLVLGFAYPPPHKLKDAMESVEAALRKSTPPVLRVTPDGRSRPAAPTITETAPLSEREAEQALQRILQRAEPSLRQKLVSSPSLRSSDAADSGTTQEQINQWRQTNQPREQTHRLTKDGWEPIPSASRQKS